MKIRPVFIYVGLLIVVILIMVFTSQNQIDIGGPMSNDKMPEDEIHNDLQDETVPGKGNVSSTFKHQMEMLKKSYEENPNDTAVVKQYAELLASAHNPQKAIELYNTILKIDSKRIDILLGITFAYYNMRNMDKAEEYTQKVLSIDKNNKEAYYNLGAIEAGKGNNAKAKEIWNDVVVRFPNSDVARIAENSIKMLTQ